MRDITSIYYKMGIICIPFLTAGSVQVENGNKNLYLYLTKLNKDTLHNLLFIHRITAPLLLRSRPQIVVSSSSSSSSSVDR